MAGSDVVRDVVRVCECQFCGEGGFTPMGIKSHQQWCDENPHPGVTPEKQAELREQGVLE